MQHQMLHDNRSPERRLLRWLLWRQGDYDFIGWLVTWAFVLLLVVTTMVVIVDVIRSTG